MTKENQQHFALERYNQIIGYLIYMFQNVKHNELRINTLYLGPTKKKTILQQILTAKKM